MAQAVLESAFTTTELPKAQSAAAEPLLSEDDCLSGPLSAMCAKQVCLDDCFNNLEIFCSKLVLLADAGSQFGLVSPERQASYVQPWQSSERGLAATHSLCLESMPRSASAPAGTAGQEEAIASNSQPSGLQQLLQRTRYEAVGLQEYAGMSDCHPAVVPGAGDGGKLTQPKRQGFGATSGTCS